MMDIVVMVKQFWTRMVAPWPNNILSYYIWMIYGT